MDNTEFSKMLSDGMSQGFIMALEMMWPYIVAFIIIGCLVSLLNAKIDQRNMRRKKQREQEEFEHKVELYLKMKDKHETTKKR